MLRYQVEGEMGLVEIVGPPTGDPEETHRLMQQLLADPGYRPGFGFLRDRRGLPALSTAEVHRNVATLAGFPELSGSRWAIIATDPANYGTSRMGGTLAGWSAIEVRIFDELEAARRWLVSNPSPAPETLDTP